MDFMGFQDVTMFVDWDTTANSESSETNYSLLIIVMSVLVLLQI